MIQITINVDGKSSWIFRRIECVFRGHEWLEWFIVGSGVPAGDRKPSFEKCSRCDKRRDTHGDGK